MIQFLADENFHRDVVRGLLRRQPELDIVLIQELRLEGLDDPSVLEWAAQNDRVVLTHDTTTMSNYAYERTRRGQPMPGVIIVDDQLAIGQAIEEIIILVGSSFEDEFENQVRYVPM